MVTEIFRFEQGENHLVCYWCKLEIKCNIERKKASTLKPLTTITQMFAKNRCRNSPNLFGITYIIFKYIY